MNYNKKQIPYDQFVWDEEYLNSNSNFPYAIYHGPWLDEDIDIRKLSTYRISLVWFLLFSQFILVPAISTLVLIISLPFIVFSLYKCLFVKQKAKEIIKKVNPKKENKINPKKENKITNPIKEEQKKIPNQIKENNKNLKEITKKEEKKKSEELNEGSKNEKSKTTTKENS